MAEGSTWQQEIERRSRDLLRVYNPLDEDYVIEWDRANGTKLFRVPAKKEVVLIRYIAEKYIREMFEKIVFDETDAAIKKENEERIAKGMKEMDKYKEQLAFEMPLIQNKRQSQREIIASLYVGVESEYGIDVQAQETTTQAPPATFADALESVQKEKGRATETKKEEADVFKCNHPGCDFETEYKGALGSHARTHNKEELVKNVSQ